MAILFANLQVNPQAVFQIKVIFYFKECFFFNFKSSSFSFQDSRDTSTHFRVHVGNQNHTHVQTSTEHLRGNSPGQTGTRKTPSQSEQTSPPGDNGNSGAEGRGQGELRCPHCMRFFNDELSDEFLKHVTECCQ